MKTCQIRHSYGDHEDDLVNEEEAIRITQTAITDGTAQPSPVLEEVAAPEGAEVEVGGKSCEWCGSRTHSRRSHKDCPANKNKNYILRNLRLLTWGHEEIV